MRLSRVELRVVRLPLVRPFRTSSSVKDHIEHLLVRVESSDGIVGWGECASPSDPYYCPETTRTCQHILTDFLVPLTLDREWESIEEFTALYRLVKGNHFAKAGLEMACWDLLGRARNRSLADLLGATRDRIASGVSLGIETDPRRLLDLVAQYQEEGYKRIKLKIAPGFDVEVVRAVRERFPDLPTQVDANSAYTLADLDHLRRLDDFGLLLIEQPLEHDDIIDHAALQRVLTTPVCLDESIHSPADARKAIEIGACRVINIKVSRMGGLLASKRTHDICEARGVPVWCGGMHEFGIGRAANLAIAGLSNFRLPGDVSGSDKYYKQDLIEPPIRAENGLIDVPRGPGLGVELIPQRLDRGTLERASFGTRVVG